MRLVFVVFGATVSLFKVFLEVTVFVVFSTLGASVTTGVTS